MGWSAPSALISLEPAIYLGPGLRRLQDGRVLQVRRLGHAGSGRAGGGRPGPGAQDDLADYLALPEAKPAALTGTSHPGAVAPDHNYLWFGGFDAAGRPG